MSRVAAPDILSRFVAVLLDMNGTLMFGGDRFGPDQDYAATYRTLGGSRLATEIVQTTITACYATMERIYNDPAVRFVPASPRHASHIASREGARRRGVEAPRGRCRPT